MDVSCEDVGLTVNLLPPVAPPVSDGEAGVGLMENLPAKLLLGDDPASASSELVDLLGLTANLYQLT